MAKVEATRRRDDRTKDALLDDRKIEIVAHEGEDQNLVVARTLTGPYVGNAYGLMGFGKGGLGQLDLSSVALALREKAQKVNAGDLSEGESLLVAQAVTLNTMFAELVRRAAFNLNDYPLAADRLAKLAMKAQNQCRMTLETLANMKNPPVVYARQANIANGPQQVNNGVPLAHAATNENRPNELLEAKHGEGVDGGAARASAGGNPALATVGGIDRASHG